MDFVEPKRGQDLVLYLYNYMKQSEFLTYVVPILSDIFVFSYPIFLIVFYLHGIYHKNYKKNKNGQKSKVGALYIFFSTLVAIGINIFVQIFVNKDRPIYFYGFQQEKTETILHKFLPVSSFPSDHATVSFAIAISTLIRAFHQKNKTLKIVGILLFLFAVIMSFCRIVTAVHRPTDIITGALIGLMISLLIFQKNILNFFKKNIFLPLIKLDEIIFKPKK